VPTLRWVGCENILTIFLQDGIYDFLTPYTPVRSNLATHLGLACAASASFVFADVESGALLLCVCVCVCARAYVYDVCV